ncbi:hypothetical protein [Nocardia brasiliensis]
MAEHHEMQCLDGGFVDVRTTLRQGEDIAEGLPVSADLGEGLFVCGQRLFVVDGGRRVIGFDVVALDAVRALDGD